MDLAPTSPTHDVRDGRFVIWSGFAIIVVYLIGAVSLQLAAAFGTGDFAGITDPHVERYGDPKDWNPPLGPDSVWNPLFWIVEICRVFVMIGLVFLLAAGTAIAGAIQLIRGGRQLGRGRFAALFVTTVLLASVAVVNVTPYGAQVRTWLLD